MNKKSLSTLIATLSLIGVITVGATISYFSSAADATNVITFGKVDIELEEYSDEEHNNPWNDETDGKNLLPGIPIHKEPIVTVEKETEDCYIRIKVEGIDNAIASNFLVNLQVEGVNPSWEKVANLPGSSNIYLTSCKDGYYKYIGTKSDENGIIRAEKMKGQSIELEPIFTTVTLNDPIEGDKSDTEIEIKVTAYAVQAATFSNEAAAFEKISF